jgi:hypothetical protein
MPPRFVGTFIIWQIVQMMRLLGDLNPIEMAFAKLKALLRKAAARTYDDLWKAVGTVCDLFTEDECFNYFIAAGHKPE